MPRINTTIGDGYIGIGDMVSLAWIAEGTRDRRDPISFYAKGSNYTVLKMLGQDVTDQPAGTGIAVTAAYKNELADGGAKLRLDYVRDLLGVSTPYKRPKIRLPPEAVEWAHKTKQGFGDKDLVLLFPQTLWQSRAWPPACWIDLAWWLSERDISAVTMLANEDKQFTNTPNFMWGFDLEKVAALMSLAKIVVGNDSGPVHLSGTMGVPTLVACGPTRPACVFGHIPEVIALTNEEPPHCTGCHFKPPFRAACDQGCQALFALKPHSVLARIVTELSLLALRPSVPLIGLATSTADQSQEKQ